MCQSSARKVDEAHGERSRAGIHRVHQNLGQVEEGVIGALSCALKAPGESTKI